MTALKFAISQVISYPVAGSSPECHDTRCGIFWCKDRGIGKALDVRVAQNGRMVLPKAARDALGLTDSGTIVVSIEGNEVKLTSMHQSVRLAQQLFSQHVHGDLTVDDFLVERRAEAGPEKARG